MTPIRYSTNSWRDGSVPLFEHPSRDGCILRHPQMRLEPRQGVGVYEIVGSLGAGGMGEVYQARDTRLGRPVAIKFVSDELAADVPRRSDWSAKPG